jgi:hypothetical protein
LFFCLSIPNAVSAADITAANHGFEAVMEFSFKHFARRKRLCKFSICFIDARFRPCRQIDIHAMDSTEMRRESHCERADRLCKTPQCVTCEVLANPTPNRTPKDGREYSIGLRRAGFHRVPTPRREPPQPSFSSRFHRDGGPFRIA